MGDAVVFAVWDSEADWIAVSDAIDGEARSETVPYDCVAWPVCDSVGVDDRDDTGDCVAVPDISLDIDDENE